METDLKFRPFRSPADPGWDEAWAIVTACVNYTCLLYTSDAADE